MAHVEILAESWFIVSHRIEHEHFIVVTMQLYIWDKAEKDEVLSKFYDNSKLQY